MHGIHFYRVTSSARIWVVLAIAFMFLVGPALVWGQANDEDRAASSRSPDELKQWFLSEYPEACKRLSAPLANITVRGRRTEADVRLTAEEVTELAKRDPVRWDRVAERAKVYRDGDFVAFIRGDSRLSEFDFTPYENSIPRPAGEVACYTPSYAFLLEKPRNRDTYLILLHSNEKDVMEKYAVITDDFAVMDSSAPHRMHDLSVSRLLDRPDCLTVTKAAQKNGRTLVQVIFQGLPQDEFWHESGRVVLDPKSDWAIAEYEILDRNPGSVRTIFGKVTYEQWADRRLIFPKCVEREMVYDCTDGKVYLRRETAVFREIQSGKVKPEQFTFPAFGLPDVPLTGTSSQPALTVDRPVQFIETLDTGKSTRLQYVFHNQGTTKIRIIGAEQSCGSSGCNSLQELPIDIPPGSDVTIKVDFDTPPQEGDFRKIFRVFTDCPFQPNVQLEIRGAAGSE